MRITKKTATRETPFMLVHNSDVVLPIKVALTCPSAHYIQAKVALTCLSAHHIQARAEQLGPMGTLNLEPMVRGNNYLREAPYNIRIT